MTIDDISHEAMNLSAGEREVLAFQLLNTLEIEVSPQTIQERWFSESKKRRAEMLNGEVDGVPLKQAMDMIDGNLK